MIGTLENLEYFYPMAGVTGNVSNKLKLAKSLEETVTKIVHQAAIIKNLNIYSITYMQEQNYCQLHDCIN